MSTITTSSYSASVVGDRSENMKIYVTYNKWQLKTESKQLNDTLGARKKLNQSHALFLTAI